MNPTKIAIPVPAPTGPLVAAADLGIFSGQDNCAAFNAIPAGTRVQLAAGVYELVTPNDAHTRTVWTMQPGIELIGSGQTLTTLAFSGHTGAYDWRGIQLAPGSWIHNLTIDTTALVVDVVGEQRHAVRCDGNGSTEPIRVDHVTCRHLAGGDCFQFVGYASVSPSYIDRRIWNVTLHDLDLTSHRSGVAVHSGLNSFEFYNIVGRAWDQVFDFEGSGDTFDGNIHDCTILVMDGQQSSIGADLNALTRLHFHHNTSIGLGIQIYWCWDCEFDHNVIVQGFPNNAATVAVLAGEDLWFHDEEYIREENMINAPVFSSIQHGSVPIRNLRISDSALIQHMSWTCVNLVGVQGFAMDHVELTLSANPSQPRIGLNMENLRSGTTIVTVSGGLDIAFCEFISSVPLYAAVTTGPGVGSVCVHDTIARTAIRGISCGTGTGPVTYWSNVMP